MTDDITARFDALSARVVHLEELLSHLESTVGGLSDELLRQGRQIDRLATDLGRVGTLVDGMRAREEAQRNPEDEKPPHY